MRNILEMAALIFRKLKNMYAKATPHPKELSGSKYSPTERRKTERQMTEHRMTESQKTQHRMTERRKYPA